MAEQNQSVLDEITDDLPYCKCSGKFKPNNNPKCYICGFEFEYQSDPLRSLQTYIC